MKARRAQTYLELRKEFLTIDADLDGVDRWVAYPENDACPQWLALKRYWYFTESEWKLAQIDSSTGDSWTESQRPRVIKGMVKPSYRSTFLNFKKRSENTDGSKFVDEIESIYSKENHASKDESLKFPMCTLTEKQKREKSKTDISAPELAAEACQCSEAPGQALQPTLMFPDNK